MERFVEVATAQAPGAHARRNGIAHDERAAEL
jgi:hypothetical protein